MKKILLMCLMFSMVVIMTSCQKPGEATISKYFEAMKLKDQETMASMSADPKRLEFKSYEIVSIGEPEFGTAILPELLNQLEEIKKQMKDQAQAAYELKDKVYEIEDQIEDTRRQSKKRQLRNELEEVKKEQKAAEQKYKDFFPQRNALKKKINIEKNYISLSTGEQKDQELLGEGKAYTMKVHVKVTLEDDSVVDYEFVLRSYEYMRNEMVIPNRLIIIKINKIEK